MCTDTNLGEIKKRQLSSFGIRANGSEFYCYVYRVHASMQKPMQTYEIGGTKRKVIRDLEDI